ncbi:MAG: hypothetical protein GXY29_04180 [Thermotogaceae bacterium]|nr:hypothetical protein [Thermotogaceae bacterium]
MNFPRKETCPVFHRQTSGIYSLRVTTVTPLIYEKYLAANTGFSPGGVVVTIHQKGTAYQS